MKYLSKPLFLIFISTFVLYKNIHPLIIGIHGVDDTPETLSCLHNNDFKTKAQSSGHTAIYTPQWRQNRLTKGSEIGNLIVAGFILAIKILNTPTTENIDIYSHSYGIYVVAFCSKFLDPNYTTNTFAQHLSCWQKPLEAERFFLGGCFPCLHTLKELYKNCHNAIQDKIQENSLDTKNFINAFFSLAAPNETNHLFDISKHTIKNRYTIYSEGDDTLTEIGNKAATLEKNLTNDYTNVNIEGRIGTSANYTSPDHVGTIQPYIIKRLLDIPSTISNFSDENNGIIYFPENLDESLEYEINDNEIIESNNLLHRILPIELRPFPYHFNPLNHANLTLQN